MEATKEILHAATSTGRWVAFQIRFALAGRIHASEAA